VQRTPTGGATLLARHQTLAPLKARIVQGFSAHNKATTVNWSSDNYKGTLAAEISGVTGSPLVGNSVDIQDGNLASGNDNVRSNAISVSATATPALLVAPERVMWQERSPLPTSRTLTSP